MDIEELLEGEWVSEDEYLICCPFCGDHPTHNHCYINVKKEVFFCHYYGETGTLDELLKKAEIGETLELKEEIVEKKKEKLIDFSLFSRVIRGGNHMNNLAFSYLKSRGMSEKEIDNYDIRFSDSGRYFGRVLFPIVEFGRVVCFSARSFLDHIKPKYLLPRTGSTILTASESIFGFGKAIEQKKGSYVLVEGIFDAIKVNRVKPEITALSILSKHLSKVQENKLLKLKNADFLVMLDADAYKEGLQVAKILASYERDVKICFLEKGDPDTSVKLEEEIKASKKYAVTFETDIGALFNLKIKV